MRQADACRMHTYQESPYERDLSCKYGRAVRLLTIASRRRNDSLKLVAARLWPAVKLNQIAFLYDSSGAAVAFASWAFLTQPVADLLLTDPSYELDISEWNEGDQLWLIDFYAPYGDAWSLCRKLRQFHLQDARRLRAVRNYANGNRKRSVDVLIRRPAQESHR